MSKGNRQRCILKTVLLDSLVGGFERLFMKDGCGVWFRVPSFLNPVVFFTHGGEAASHGVFCDRAGIHELEEVIRPARLGTDTRHLETAERLALHQGAGDTPVKIQVSDPEFSAGLSQVMGASTKYPTGERKLGGIGQVNGLVKSLGLHDGKHWPEDFLLRQPMLGSNVGKYS